MMLTNFYEHEKSNKNIDDGVSEYCRMEQLNEEHFRYLARKESLGGKDKKKIVILVILMLCIIGLGIGCSKNESNETEDGILYASESFGWSMELGLGQILTKCSFQNVMCQ